MKLYNFLCRSVPAFNDYDKVCRVKQVRKRQGDLLNYIVFLRVTPLLPNTFINVCAPIVRVPLPHFALGAHLRCCCALGGILISVTGIFESPRWHGGIADALPLADLSVCMYCMQKACSCCCEQLYLLAGTLIGCLPNNFLAVHAGSKLQSLTSFRDLYSPVRALAGFLSMIVGAK